LINGPSLWPYNTIKELLNTGLQNLCQEIAGKRIKGKKQNAKCKMQKTKRKAQGSEQEMVGLSPTEPYCLSFREIVISGALFWFVFWASKK
jgi:hypothetical protein